MGADPRDGDDRRAVLDLGAEAGSDKLPYELDEAARIDGASPLQLFRLVYLPLMTPSLVAVGTYALLLAWNEYLYAFLLLSNDRDITLAVALGNFLVGGRFAVGAADDDGPASMRCRRRRSTTRSSATWSAG